MTERTWTKFKDELPEEFYAVFVTDWTKVWAMCDKTIRQLQQTKEYFPEYAWSYIEMPETPHE